MMRKSSPYQLIGFQIHATHEEDKISTYVLYNYISTSKHIGKSLEDKEDTKRKISLKFRDTTLQLVQIEAILSKGKGPTSPGASVIPIDVSTSN